METMICELYGTRGKCSYGTLQNHHLLNLGKLSKIFKKNRDARTYVEDTYAHIFIAKVCANHNAGTKDADTKWARAHLVELRDKLYGVPYTRDAIDGLQEFLKVPEPMWTHEGIRAGG